MLWELNPALTESTRRHRHPSVRVVRMTWEEGGKTAISEIVHPEAKKLDEIIRCVAVGRSTRVQYSTPWYWGAGLDGTRVRGPRRRRSSTRSSAAWQ